MSSFTAFATRTAKAGWAGAGRWPAKFYELRAEKKQRESTLNKAGTGCIGFLLFGLLVFFIPLVCMLAIEAVVVSWAVLWSLLALVGTGVDRLTGAT